MVAVELVAEAAEGDLGAARDRSGAEIELDGGRVADVQVGPGRRDRLRDGMVMFREPLQSCARAGDATPTASTTAAAAATRPSDSFTRNACMCILLVIVQLAAWPTLMVASADSCPITDAPLLLPSRGVNNFLRPPSTAEGCIRPGIARGAR